MKFFLASFTILFSISSLAQTGADYQIYGGKLHRGGKGYIEVLSNEEHYIVKMNYEIYKRALVPVSADDLKGETIIELPSQFIDERGYAELERLKTIKLEDAEIKFIQRTSFREFNDAYQFQVIPRNGKSKIEVIYHPLLPATGWGRVKIIFISHIPMLNGYQAVAEMK
ncbi:MAG: hypothetical protein AB7I27_12585 [Bacteriovoracaceae bacterium]